jgi:hypothetical protein
MYIHTYTYLYRVKEEDTLRTRAAAMTLLRPGYMPQVVTAGMPASLVAKEKKYFYVIKDICRRLSRLGWLLCVCVCERERERERDREREKERESM